VADAEKAAQINQPVCHRQLVPTFYILDVHKEPNDSSSPTATEKSPVTSNNPKL
jgi:hypothetical protein